MGEGSRISLRGGGVINIITWGRGSRISLRGGGATNIITWGRGHKYHYLGEGSRISLRGGGVAPSREISMSPNNLFL